MDRGVSQPVVHVVSKSQICTKHTHTQMNGPDLLLSASSLYSLYNRPINLGDEVLRQGIWLYSERWLTEKMADKCLKITTLSRPGCQVLLWIRNGGKKGDKVKKTICKHLWEWQALRRGSLISFFLQSPGGEDYDEKHFSLTGKARGPGFPEAGDHVFL